MESASQSALAAFLARAGLGQSELVALAGGRNNRVSLVRVHEESRAVLKVYFRHPGDRRDRLGHEWDFCSAFAPRCPGRVPRALARDVEAGLALYEVLPGQAWEPGQAPGEASLEQVREFLRDLNAPPRPRLAWAAESARSLAEHRERVEERLARVEAVAELRAFAQTELRPRLERSWEACSPCRECVSPSDLGFHNVLVGPDGRLAFVDFEYAGLDDPAKLICDFFCQPRIPVGLEHFRLFEPVFGRLAQQRARTLLPLYLVKWACILLNPLLPVAGQRRGFAGAGAPEPALVLARVRSWLEEMDGALGRMPH